jgi:hypothetical protein
MSITNITNIMNMMNMMNIANETIKKDNKMLNKMNSSQQKKLLEYRNNNQVTCVELSIREIDMIYCMKCLRLFDKETSTQEEYGMVDDIDILHCCLQCNKCHTTHDGWYCTHCKECHDGSENDLELTYKTCPLCKRCLRLSLWQSTNIECEYCNHKFNMSDCAKTY